MGAIINITGLKFGKLTVSSRSEIKKGKEILWECICDCGGKKITRAADLKNGKTQSCGCIKSSMLVSRNTKHGFAGTRIYEIWQGMVKRCTNPNCKAYRLYGGRGITVCERWMNFIDFYNDTLQGYSDKLSLDRFPDTNGNYEPNNFRWATEKQQGNNKRDNHLVKYDNKILTISEWAELTGFSYGMIECRLRKGWDIEKALTLPPQKITNNRRDFKGKHLYDKLNNGTQDG